MSATFAWVRPPRALGNDVRSWGRRMLDALYDLAVYFAGVFQRYAKLNAKWTDRTGHARGGLTAIAVRAGAIVFIYLFHTMTYGWWLEVAMAGKYAILMPTVLHHLADVIRAMKRLGTR